MESKPGHFRPRISAVLDTSQAGSREHPPSGGGANRPTGIVEVGRFASPLGGKWCDSLQRDASQGGGRSGLSEAAPTRVFAVGLHECPQVDREAASGGTGSGTDISTGADQVQHSCRPTSAPLLNWSHSSLFLPLLSSIPITGTPRGLIQQRDRSPAPCQLAPIRDFRPLIPAIPSRRFLGHLSG
jgi:hypothetical protein